jgi:hypothetical protein
MYRKAIPDSTKCVATIGKDHNVPRQSCLVLNTNGVITAECSSCDIIRVVTRREETLLKKYLFKRL